MRRRSHRTVKQVSGNGRTCNLLLKIRIFGFISSYDELFGVFLGRNFTKKQKQKETLLNICVLYYRRCKSLKFLHHVQPLLSTVRLHSSKLLAPVEFCVLRKTPYELSNVAKFLRAEYSFLITAIHALAIAGYAKYK